MLGFLLGFAAVPLARILDPDEPVQEFHPLDFEAVNLPLD